MGHTRLGTIPKLRKWNDVAALFATSSADDLSEVEVDRIALGTLKAAEPALTGASGDPTLQMSFLLLARLVLAARQADWTQELEALGISLDANASLLDLTAAVHAAIDRGVRQGGPATDVGEMAQRALGEAVAKLAGPKSTTLFGTGPEELKTALRELSTKKGFADLGQEFFGGFLARFLNFYLSRIATGLVGSSRLRQLGDLGAFNKQLQHHCHQSARIVRDFCGEWYSKTEFREGINLENSRKFVAIALQKLAYELKRQETGE